MRGDNDGHGFNRLVATRLNAMSPLSAESEAIIQGLSHLSHHSVGAELVRDREPPLPRFLVQGWAARLRWLPDGRRQIITFILPGDAIGICERPHPLALSPVVALTDGRTLNGRAVAAALASATPSDLSDAFHISTAFDAAGLIDQVVRLGRQTAYERLAHLLLEFGHRLALAGLASTSDYPCPLTQEMLADATGLSVVHVNRTLQQMRRDELLEFRQGHVRLLQIDLLQAISDWRSPRPLEWARH